MTEHTKGKWLMLFLGAKYNHFLQFLDLRISDHWLLLRAVQDEYGQEKAKALWTRAILLGLKYGVKNNKQTIAKIVDATTKAALEGVK